MFQNLFSHQVVIKPEFFVPLMVQIGHCEIHLLIKCGKVEKVASEISN